MALGIKFADGDKGVACPTLTVIGCGGKPPYKWSISIGTIEPDGIFKATVKPPDNPGANVAGTAYLLQAIYCTFGGFSDCVCKPFNCDGSAGACFGLGCGGNCARPCATGCSGGVPLAFKHVDCANVTDGVCDGLPVFSDVCAGVTAVPQFVCDVRTPTMKSNGCQPCGAVMQDAVVTVTDANGVSVSRTLKGA